MKNEGTFIYTEDVRQEQFDIQSAIDEKIQDINDYYGYDFGHHVVSVYESEDLLDPDRAIALKLGWASIGEVSIEEAEAFVRIMESAISQAKLAHCPGACVTYNKEEANYSPYGNTDTDDDDIIDHDIVDDTDDDEEEFLVETEITADTPRDWDWFDSVIIVDKHNRESGIYESEGREAEYAAFEAISLIEDIKDDTIKSEAETEAMGAYETQLDAVARVMSYNEVLQKYCLDDILPRLSIKVTMHMIPNDGEFYDDEETIMAVCDDINGAMVYDDKHPSRGISMTCKEWKLVEDRAKEYGRQADSGIIDALING